MPSPTAAGSLTFDAIEVRARVLACTGRELTDAEAVAIAGAIRASVVPFEVGMTAVESLLATPPLELERMVAALASFGSGA